MKRRLTVRQKRIVPGFDLGRTRDRSELAVFEEDFDYFGRAGPAQFRDRKFVPEIRGTLTRLASSNEMVFQHGIPVDALRGVVIPNASTRRRIIQKLRDAGITEVIGKPIEEFIMSRERF